MPRPPRIRPTPAVARVGPTAFSANASAESVGLVVPAAGLVAATSARPIVEASDRSADSRDLDRERPDQDGRAGEQDVARALPRGARQPANAPLVDDPLARDDPPVGRDGLRRVDQDPVAGPEPLDRHEHLGPVAAHEPRQAGPRKGLVEHPPPLGREVEPEPAVPELEHPRHDRRRQELPARHRRHDDGRVEDRQPQPAAPGLPVCRPEHPHVRADEQGRRDRGHDRHDEVGQRGDAQVRVRQAEPGAGRRGERADPAAGVLKRLLDEPEQAGRVQLGRVVADQERPGPAGEPRGADARHAGEQDLGAGGEAGVIGDRLVPEPKPAWSIRDDLAGREGRAVAVDGAIALARGPRQAGRGAVVVSPQRVGEPAEDRGVSAMAGIESHGRGRGRSVERDRADALHAQGPPDESFEQSRAREEPPVPQRDGPLGPGDLRGFVQARGRRLHRHGMRATRLRFRPAAAASTA